MITDRIDSTQSYYHNLLCTQRIKSDLRTTREIWTALIPWKITLRAVKSWFDSPSSEKVKVSPPTFSPLFSPLKCSFRCLSFSLSERLNFPLVCQSYLVKSKRWSTYGFKGFILVWQSDHHWNVSYTKAVICFYNNGNSRRNYQTDGEDDR